MPNEFAYGVFLSHNSADKPRVRRLAERLRAAGLRVWFDEWVIPVASVYDRRDDGRRSQSAATAAKIERGLEAARTLVLCLSPAALGSDRVGLACPAEASPHGRTCLAEAHRRRRKRGTVLFRAPANAGRRFIPLLLAAAHRHEEPVAICDLESA